MNNNKINYDSFTLEGYLKQIESEENDIQTLIRDLSELPDPKTISNHKTLAAWHYDVLCLIDRAKEINKRAGKR